MVISAINALTLSPALCALLLRHRGRAEGVMAVLQSGIDTSRDGYVELVHAMARRALIAGLLVRRLLCAATGWLGNVVPTGFLPEEDQGAFMAEVQLPEAASINRTGRGRAAGRGHDPGRPWRRRMSFTVNGYSLLDGLEPAEPRASSSSALKPFAERNGEGPVGVRRAGRDAARCSRQIAAANVFAFNLPPIMGLGNAVRLRVPGAEPRPARSPAELAAVARGLVMAAQPGARAAGVYTTYGAATPQIYLDLDRERAQTLGIEDQRHLRRPADGAWAAPTPTTSTCSAAPGR